MSSYSLIWFSCYSILSKFYQLSFLCVSMFLLSINFSPFLAWFIVTAIIIFLLYSFFTIIVFLFFYLFLPLSFFIFLCSYLFIYFFILYLPLSFFSIFFPDSFEEVLPDLTNLSEYTYESLVFSFSLIGAAGNLMSDENDNDEVDIVTGK